MILFTVAVHQSSIYSSNAHTMTEHILHRLTVFQLSLTLVDMYLLRNLNYILNVFSSIG